MALYMKMDGINGNVTTKGHEGWIDIKSARFSCHRQIKLDVGHGADRETSIPHFNEVVITKHTDISSADLFTHMLKGDAIPTVTLDVCNTADEVSAYVQYHLSDVMISQLNDFIPGASCQPLETLSLHYTSIEKRFTPKDHANQAQSPKSAGYNLITATTL